MDFHLLEVQKPRSALKQQLKQQHVGQASPDNPRWMFWRKVDQYIRDENVPVAYRPRLLRLLHALEDKNGSEYMQRIPQAKLREVIRTFHKRYELDREVKLARLNRSGVSGVTSGRHGGTLTHRVPVNYQLQANLADVDLRGLSQGELEQSDHPDIQRLGRAVSPHRLGHERDPSVVWDKAGIPYYLLIHPYKRPPRYKEAQKGVQRFEAVLPGDLIFKAGKQITPEHWKTYTKETEKWRRIMQSRELRKISVVPAKTVDEAVVKLQHHAWNEAKLFWQFWTKLQDIERDIEHLERDQKPVNQNQKTYLQREFGDKEGYEKYRGMELAAKEKQDLLRAKMLLSEVFQDILRGRVPKISFGDPKRDAAFAEAARGMKKSYTFYLWLLASEDEYGIRVAERRQMYPAHSHEPTGLKSREPFWSVRKETEEGGEWSWDWGTLRGLGYSPNQAEDFKRDLRNTRYRKAIRSEDAVADLWVPYVPSAGKPLTLKLHPVNVSDYIEKSRKTGKARPQAKNIAGKTGQVLKVENIQTPIFIFYKNGVEFGLISAMDYLRHFDSPHHTGSRFVHGQGMTEPRRAYDPEHPRPLQTRVAASKFAWPQRQQRGMSFRTKERSKSWQNKKFVKTGVTPRTAYDPEETRWRRKHGEIEAAERVFGILKARQAQREQMKTLNIQTDKHGRYVMANKQRLRNPTVVKNEIGGVPTFQQVLRKVKK